MCGLKKPKQPISKQEMKNVPLVQMRRDLALAEEMGPKGCLLAGRLSPCRNFNYIPIFFYSG